MKLHGSVKKKKKNARNVEVVLVKEIIEVVLVHCNIVNNGYQHDSRVLHTFVLDKLFGQSIDI